MPYIKQEDRDELVINIQQGHWSNINKYLAYDKINNAGEMQYAIALIIKSYLEKKGFVYQNINDVMGALAGAQMEFYRSTVAPFEDNAIKRNGNI